MIARWWLFPTCYLLVVACLAAMGALAKAYADSGGSVTTALITQLPAILTATGVLLTSAVGLVTLWKTNVVHGLVNSQFAEAKKEIQAAKDEVAALKRYIAGLPGSSVEEKIRADVATEQSRQPLPLPKNS